MDGFKKCTLKVWNNSIKIKCVSKTLKVSKLTPSLSDIPGHTRSNLVTILFRSVFGLKAKRSFSFVGWTRTLELLERINTQYVMLNMINFTMVGERVFLFSFLSISSEYFPALRNTNTASGVLPILSAIQSTIPMTFFWFLRVLKLSNPTTTTEQEMGSVNVQNDLKFLLIY